MCLLHTLCEPIRVPVRREPPIRRNPQMIRGDGIDDIESVNICIVHPVFQFIGDLFRVADEDWARPPSATSSAISFGVMPAKPFKIERIASFWMYSTFSSGSTVDKSTPVHPPTSANAPSRLMYCL